MFVEIKFFGSQFEFVDEELKRLAVGFVAPMRRLLTLLLIVACSNSYAGEEAFVFAHFSDEQAGLLLAVSRDGLTWDMVNSGRPVLKKPFGPVFRDPALTRASDGEIYMVWTTGWKDENGIGFAKSRNLLHWDSIRKIPLMTHTTGALNVWAPELFYDGAGDRWMLYWASSVKGRFPETKPPKPSYNNRMYHAISTDGMETLGPEQLHYDEGFITNDAYILKTDGEPRGKYCQFTKKVTSKIRHGDKVQIHLAFSEQLTGPYQITGGPITGDYLFAEGPTAIKIGEYYYCYFDISPHHRMGCVRSRDLKADPWEDVTDQLTLPPRTKHGSVLRISEELYEQLRKHGAAE